GKGTVQTILDMNENIPLLHLKKYSDLGALKVTIQKFYRINGGSTQYKGVEPDIVLPSLFQHLKSGEQYLDNSLPWSQVEAVDYYSTPARNINIKKIRNKSLKRIQKDEALQIIAEEAERSIERSSKTRISLKLSDMEKQKEEARLAREKVGAHYKKYQDEALGDELGEGKEDGKKPNGEEWIEDINDDPYVKEAINIVLDIGKMMSSQ
ncbi:MAG: tail-specific protease, partial [Bacteroidetes bacterium]|nr:tail-specific protease [Bacteroidota bacterium]